MLTTNMAAAFRKFEVKADKMNVSEMCNLLDNIMQGNRKLLPLMY
jgi:hypothetical protein